jgi:hypothetical protein
MRDFSDAKTMARSIRRSLADKGVTMTHAESLELMAKAFGFDNWNILAAKIETEGQPVNELSAQNGSKPMCCSFCGKTQHHVTILIAGPAVSICNECIELCGNILEDRQIDGLIADAPGRDAFAVTLEYIRSKSDDELSSYKPRAEDWRDYVRWSLRQATEALTRLETGVAWVPDEFASARGWSRDPTAGRSREDILELCASLERQLALTAERLRAAEAVLLEREQQ